MARRGYTFQQQQNSAITTHKEARYSNHISTTHHHLAGFMDQGCLIGGTYHNATGFIDQGRLIGGGREATWHSHGEFIIPNNSLIIKNGSNSLFNGSSQFSNFGAAVARDSELEAFREVWDSAPRGNVRTEEVRYERRSWGGDGSNYGYFNGVDGFNNNNVNRSGFTTVEWISKPKGF